MNLIVKKLFEKINREEEKIKRKEGKREKLKQDRKNFFNKDVLRCLEDRFLNEQAKQVCEFSKYLNNFPYPIFNESNTQLVLNEICSSYVGDFPKTRFDFKRGFQGWGREDSYTNVYLDNFLYFNYSKKGLGFIVKAACSLKYRDHTSPRTTRQHCRACHGASMGWEQGRRR